ncbi:MAG: hypothetical protein AAGD01_01815 [Acidobacteriota bacterium]
MTITMDLIVSLQSTINELREARERIDNIPDWMHELHAEHSAQKEEIDQLEESAQTAETERREAQDRISEEREKLQRYQDQLNEVRTQREYGALLQEIDTAKTQISEHESVVKEASERNEQNKVQLEENKITFLELDERYQGEFSKWESEKPEVAAQIEVLEAREAELRQEIPRPTLSQFDRIAKRHKGSALAQVIELESTRRKAGPRIWHCGFCNFNIRPQLVVELHRSDGLVLCESCKHILYLAPQDNSEEE